MTILRYKVFDIHTHTYPEAISQKAVSSLGKFYNFEVHGKGTYADLAEQANNTKGRDIEFAGFLLFSVATNAHQVNKVNDSIAALAEKARSEGFEAVGFAGMHQDYEDYEGEIKRCEDMGLRGVKIHPDIQRMDLESKEMYRLCEIMEGRLPLFLHMGDDRAEYRYSEPKKLAKLLERFPRLEVVAAHFGGYKAWDEAEEYLYGRPNVWYDLSSALWAMTPERARELIDKCGHDRVMFGTDYPVCSLDEYVDLFMKIELDDSVRADIFYNNAHRFLKLK